MHWAKEQREMRDGRWEIHVTFLRSVARKRNLELGKHRVGTPRVRQVFCCYCFHLTARPEMCGQKEGMVGEEARGDPGRKSSQVHEMHT